MITPVVEVAKPGYDIKTCTNDQKVFSSKFNILKVAYRGEPTASGSYTHGLAFTPAFFVANGQFDDSSIWGFVGQYSSPSSFEAPFYCSSTKFTYWIKCKYFLLYQDAST